MIWADRIAIVWALVVALCVLLASAPHYEAGFAALVTEGWRIALITVAPVWLLLRALDWMTGGPYRRRGAVRARII